MLLRVSHRRPGRRRFAQTPEEHVLRLRSNLRRARLRGARALVAFGGVYLAFVRYADEVLRAIAATPGAVGLDLLGASTRAIAGTGGRGARPRAMPMARAAVRRGFIMPWADVTALVAARRGDDTGTAVSAAPKKQAPQGSVAVDGLSFTDLVADAPALSAVERAKIVSALLGRASVRCERLVSGGGGDGGGGDLVTCGTSQRTGRGAA